MAVRPRDGPAEGIGMDVAIVGAGRTGRTLGRLAREAGYEIGPVVCRTRAHAEEAVRFIGAGRAGTSSPTR